ncbi:hypothetical protein GGR53DRAFT_462533 [Hypoxylon sp. FL1150]|nr:hypothetical protein GGR53DRAFT_462533 [Hypoxylon sp. FL1150]
MPSATPFEVPTLAPAKKRRRDGDHIESQITLTTRNDTQPQAPLGTINNNERLIVPSPSRGNDGTLVNIPRNVMPMPVAKKFRVLSSEHLHPGYLIPSQSLSLQQSPLFHHAHPDYSTSPASPQVAQTITTAKSMTTTPALLSPCHICHRKPTKRPDLDSFADCMGCGQRACYVCIRACEGWLPPSLPTEAEYDAQMSESFTMKDADDDFGSTEYLDEPVLHEQQPGTSSDGGELQGGWSGRGHRDVICSRCCVERGRDGDVVCLGCLAWLEGTWDVPVRHAQNHYAGW